MQRKIRNGFLNLISLSCILFITACSTVDSQAVYNSAQPRTTDTLATPPGLNPPDLSSSYKMTEPQFQTAYKAANISGMSIKSGGSQRWLVMESQTVNKIWPEMMAYVSQLGLTAKYQNKAIGLIQTDWATRNTKVPQGLSLRGLFSWVGLGSMYSLDSMYMYRITLWQDGNNVVVMATNYQMDEVYEGCGNQGLSTTSSLASSDTQRTKWIPRPSNPQLELDFLAQFMVFAGMPDDQVKKAVVQVKALPKETNLVNDQLVVKDQFDRAWWRTAIALDRVGLGVVDKNRSNGEYYVYPLQSQIDNPDPGFLNKWFGSSESAGTARLKPLYTIKLTPSGNNTIVALHLYDSQSQDKKFAEHQKKYLDGLAAQLQ